jgi:hypothetical protein
VTSVRGDVVVLLLLTVAGCHKADNQSPPPPERPQADAPAAGQTSPAKADNTMNATLDWTLTPRADSLHVDYKLTNQTDASLWVVDDMLTWTQGALTRAPNAIIVRNSTKPGVASLFRGNLNIPTHDQRMYPSPGMREVAPGATVAGSADIPLPLRAWHNYHPDKIEALRPDIKQVELEIQVVPQQGVEDKDWKYETLADGSRVASPFLRVLDTQGQIVSGGAKDLP